MKKNLMGGWSRSFRSSCVQAKRTEKACGRQCAGYSGVDESDDRDRGQKMYVSAYIF